MASQVLHISAVHAVHPAGAKYLPSTQVSQVAGVAQVLHLVEVPKHSPQVPMVESKVLVESQAEQ